MTTNGDKEQERPKIERFKMDRSLAGVAYAYMDIAERVMNDEVEDKKAREATRALDGVPKLVKAQLDAIRTFEKGSSASVREEAGKLLGITSHEAIADGGRKN